MHTWIGFLSSFLASAVEVVEAVTLVLAAGVTRGWRSTWIGVGCAALALAVLVVVFGPALQGLIPLDVLRIVIGTLLAWWLFKEPRPAVKIVGSLVVLAGIGLLAVPA